MLCFSSGGLSVTEGQADMTGGKPGARADVTVLRQRCRLDSVLRRATETKFFFLAAHNEDFQRKTSPARCQTVRGVRKFYNPGGTLRVILDAGGLKIDKTSE